MGEPAVFTLSFSKFFGFGISLDRFNDVYDLTFSLPFIYFSIYFKKSKDNKWFNFYGF